MSLPDVTRPVFPSYADMVKAHVTLKGEVDFTAAMYPGDEQAAVRLPLPVARALLSTSQAGLDTIGYNRRKHEPRQDESGAWSNCDCDDCTDRRERAALVDRNT